MAAVVDVVLPPAEVVVVRGGRVVEAALPSLQAVPKTMIAKPALPMSRMAVRLVMSRAGPIGGYPNPVKGPEIVSPRGEGQVVPAPFPAWAGSSNGVIVRAAFGLLGTLLGLFLVGMALYVRLAATILADLLQVPDRTTGAVALFATFGSFVIGASLLAAVRPSRLTVAFGGFGFIAAAAILIWLSLG